MSDGLHLVTIHNADQRVQSFDFEKEMCIRDRQYLAAQPGEGKQTAVTVLLQAAAAHFQLFSPVSYTHLDKRCARFSAGFIVQRLMRQAKVERKSVQFMMARMPVEIGGVAYYLSLIHI